ncbi:MAG TPA: putative peptidoglycan glycosyltransferase FtsW [Candidatus Saccharimonadales bacterium]|nr:putative peptidoglycan glycosyltransferase FtsW [Candidatus Saccharimonadales bacterium]
MSIFGSSAVRRPLSQSRTSGRRHRPDYMLVMLCSILMVIGLVVIYAISPALSIQKQVSENYFVSKQLIAIVLGLVVFVATANLPISYWRQLKNPLIIAAGVAAVAVRLFGERVNGAYRWIQIGGLSFQAVELIKFTLMIWLAMFLADRLRDGTINSNQDVFRKLLAVLIILGIVVGILQSDLGSLGVIVAMMASICFVAGLPLKRVFIIGGIIAIGVVMLISTSTYRRDRLLTYLHPQRDCQGAGYQACQAVISVGSGGLFGKGLGRGVQGFGYVPEAANDSIFAIYSEKFGFIGVVALLCIFMVLFTRLKNIMERTTDNFSQFIVAGVLAWLSIQTVINIGAMIGLLPLKGITLPFISYGGTSIIFITAAVGIVFNISRYTDLSPNLIAERGSYDNSGQRRRVRRPHHAYLSRRP